MSDEAVIQTRGLTKYFGRHCAVDQMDLAVPRGTVFALLGRNGSGKTTTIRMLLGMLEPTRGSATVLGDDCTRLAPQTRARIGYLTEGHELYPWMSVREAERFQAAFFPKWNHNVFLAATDHFNLRDGMKTRDLSRGQRAGLALALVLAPDPELLILDDPALGLDTVARQALLESILYLTRDANRTIMLTGHLLGDVERVADMVAVIDQSVLRACAPVESFPAEIVQFELSFDVLPQGLPAIRGLLQARFSDAGITLTLVQPDGAVMEMLRGLNPASMRQVPLTFEEALTAYMADREVKPRLIDRLGGAA